MTHRLLDDIDDDELEMSDPTEESGTILVMSVVNGEDWEDSIVTLEIVELLQFGEMLREPSGCRNVSGCYVRGMVVVTWQLDARVVTWYLLTSQSLFSEKVRG